MTNKRDTCGSVYNFRYIQELQEEEQCLTHLGIKMFVYTLIYLTFLYYQSLDFARLNLFFFFGYMQD